jgi:ABC-type branched-subunit amino acid transport system permease subunit
MFFQFDWLRNGQLGWTYSRPKLGFIDLAQDRTLAIVVVVLIAGVALLIRNLERSTTGREMLAVRNAPAAAASVGVSPAMTKLRVFALSAGVAGLGGVLLATNDLTITNNSISPLAGLLWLAGVVLLGVRRTSGAIAAGLLLTLMPALFGGFTLPFDLLHWSGTKSSEIPTILFGLGAVGLARQPDGIFQDIARANYERRQRRRDRRVDLTAPADAATATVDDVPTPVGR